MATTKVTSQSYTATGTQSTKYTFTFPYIRQTDVVVRINDVIEPTTSYTFPTATEIQFVTGQVPTSGKSIEIYRDTNVDIAEATFGSGSSIRAQDLNNNAEQLLFDSQEQARAEDIAWFAVTLPKINPGTENQILTTIISGGKTAADWSDNIDINGTLDVTGATDLDSTLNVDGAATFQDNVTINADNKEFKIQNNSGVNQFTVDTDNGNTIIKGTLDVDGDTSLDGTTIDGILDVNGSATIDNVQINGNEIDTTSGGLTLDSTSGTVTVDDNLVVTGTFNVGGNPGPPQLGTPRTIAQSGDVVWSVSFDGSADVTAAATIQADAVENSMIATDAVDTLEIKDNAVTVAKINDTELTTLAGMQNATAGILAGSTALAATLPEINKICDGMDYETSSQGISSTDAKYATSKAIREYVSNVVTAVGGFVAIQNPTSFPSTQPDDDVVVSIGDVGAGFTTSSGEITITDGAGSGKNVKITNFPSSLTAETLQDDTALQVTSDKTNSTATLHVYKYHKWLVKESDVKQLSDDINEFNVRYRTATNKTADNDSSNDAGDLFYEQSVNKMFVYEGVYNSGGSWKEVTSVGDFNYLVLCNAGTTNAATYNGSDVSFDLKIGSTSGNAANVTSAAQLMVSVNGVIQKPNAGTNTSGLDGFVMTDVDTIKFTAGPPANADIFVIQSGAALNINVPGDNTVTSAKIVNGTILNEDINAAANIAGSKLADDSIAEVKLDIHNAPSGTDKYLKYTSNGMEWATVAQYTTPLTTQGDILYRDGSGDQRLAKGSAGQVLKMNSGATAPEWAADNNTVYTHPNHSGEVTSTGDGATVITDDVVDEANLKISNAGSNGQFLQKQSGNTGGLTWASVAGTITALNNQAENRLVSIGATTTELDGEANLTFQDTTSTGLICGKQITGRGFECPATVSDDWTIAAGNNAMFPGPMTVASGKTVTVPANRTLTVV